MNIKSELAQHSLFYMNYKSMLEGDKYYIYDKRGRKIVYVKKPESKGAQDIGIYTMIDKTLKKVFSLRTKEPVPTTEYFLYDEKDNLVSMYKHNGAASLMRSVWSVDSNCRVVEKTCFSKIVKLSVKKETYVESDFEIYYDNIQIGSFIRSKKFGGRNVLDLSKDTGKKLDRVAALGLAIVLDMIEK
jgi:uncharacterized protein YxjI